MGKKAIHLCINRWAVWPPKSPNEVGVPPCAFVEAGLRRRLSPLARVALFLANECAADLPLVRVVFASRHGELNKTHIMLTDIARGEDISPTAFSLSVHNAIPGLFSILRNDATATTALAASEGTLGMGLFHAGLEYAILEMPVLFIYADVPLENDLYTGIDEIPMPCGLALLLDSQGIALEVSRIKEHSEECASYASLQKLVDVLHGVEEDIFLSDRRGCWKVTRAI